MDQDRSSWQTSTPVALLERAAAGDEQALQVVLTTNYESLRAVIDDRISPRFRSQIDAEDVIQQAHIAVFQRLGSFERRGAGAFERWVVAIALNRLRSQIRDLRAIKRGGGARRVAAPRTPEGSAMILWDVLTRSGSTPSAHVRRDEAVEALGVAIDTLPEDHREAIRLVYLEGKSVREAASALRRTERAVHGLCRRAMTSLRARLAILDDP